MGVGARCAKSGGTGELGSQKVNWPAESFLGQEEKLLKTSLQTFPQKIMHYLYDVSLDKDFNINFNYR